MKKLLNKFIEDALHENNKTDVLDNPFLAIIEKARKEGTIAGDITIDLDDKDFHHEQPDKISKIIIDN
jgi:hypothetical protein